MHIRKKNIKLNYYQIKVWKNETEIEYWRMEIWRSLAATRCAPPAFATTKDPCCCDAPRNFTSARITVDCLGDKHWIEKGKICDALLLWPPWLHSLHENQTPTLLRPSSNLHSGQNHDGMRQRQTLKRKGRGFRVKPWREPLLSCSFGGSWVSWGLEAKCCSNNTHHF